MPTLRALKINHAYLACPSDQFMPPLPALSIPHGCVAAAPASSSSQARPSSKRPLEERLSYALSYHLPPPQDPNAQLPPDLAQAGDSAAAIHLLNSYPAAESDAAMKVLQREASSASSLRRLLLVGCYAAAIQAIQSCGGEAGDLLNDVAIMSLPLPTLMAKVRDGVPTTASADGSGGAGEVLPGICPASGLLFWSFLFRL
jgi:hypothetical protein